MRSLKTTFVGALADMRQELPLLDKALKLIHNPIVMLTTAIGAVAAGVRRLHQFANECVETYKVQAEAESKLAQVMRNTMGARNSEIDSIKRLASEQQKLGVIGDEVQLAGAQELGTYLTKAKNLRTLLPVMNDMVAQQYGYNATQESAVNIATMMGKVMDGQVGALSRYGYKFTEAQEAILKFGTEEQRAATLAEVVSESVGGVNAALAQTPEGALKQYENNLGDLHERFGQFFTYIRAAWLPVGQAFMDGWNKVAALFESHRTQIMSVIQTVASHVATVINGVFTMLGYLKNAVSFLYEWRAAIYGAAAAYAILNAKQIAAITLTGLQAAKTAILTAAQWLLNVAMSANPIGIIIVAIGALIGAIIALCRRYEGWTSVWNAVKTTLVLSFKQYVENWKFGIKELWMDLQIFWERIKSFGSNVGNVFKALAQAMKSVLKGDFEGAKAALANGFTFSTSANVTALEQQRDANRQNFKDESMARAKEIADACRTSLPARLDPAFHGKVVAKRKFRAEIGNNKHSAVFRAIAAACLGQRESTAGIGRSERDRWIGRIARERAVLVGHHARCRVHCTVKSSRERGAPHRVAAVDAARLRHAERPVRHGGTRRRCGRSAFAGAKEFRRLEHFVGDSPVVKCRLNLVAARKETGSDLKPRCGIAEISFIPRLAGKRAVQVKFPVILPSRRRQRLMDERHVQPRVCDSV